MNPYKQKLNAIFKGYLTAVILLILGMISVIFIPIPIDYKWSLFLIGVVVLFIISLFARPRIEYYGQQSRLEALVSTANPPIPSPIEINSDAWIARIQSMGFVLNKEFKDYYLAHRVHQDPSSLVTKRGILEVMVFIRNQSIPYSDDRFNRVIRQIEDEYVKSKTPYHHYTILIFKLGDDLSDEIKKNVHEVYFNKSNHRFVTILHAYGIRKTKQLYFLHSETSSPNLFYDEAVRLMKETIHA